MFHMRTWIISILFLPLAANSGCNLSGDMAAVQTTSNQPRAGNVYLVRGLIGIFSRGMDDVADKLNKQGVRAHVYQDAQRSELADLLTAKYRKDKDAEPLILVGHSLGADDVVFIARQLEKASIPVDLMITIDPVSPGKVPANVRRTINLYKSKGALGAIPMFRGIALDPDKPNLHLANIDLRVARKDLDADGSVGHFNIDDTEAIQNEIVKQVLIAAPDRQTYAAARRPTQLAATPSPRRSQGQ
jgi:thioesterase domain-containing protein